ncbi:DUF1800 domain-containing protein [Uliginosibacterium aquaticum]|uniref:DUF1800 domain-containing protein n=1 Tax=Uliginosibacterium aquaticum TaxID=2731212 RepID=A0ABX2IEU2_9RHOO|nr:DUF1800 domain-containing protein [Uliginosibacterium aquaticum]NSL55205.1 DUF1800 domain-containing protein [Uliginosibacterium aquaticum]
MKLLRSCLPLFLGLLAACGSTPPRSDPWAYPDSPAAIKRPATPPGPRYPAPSPVEASRFLQQASFGPNQAEIDALARSDYHNWLKQQFSLPQTLFLPDVEPHHAQLAKGQNLRQQLFFEIFWKHAATAPDQLRQRVAFALSEIFVISFEGMLDVKIRGVASYYDMLGRNAFGDFRSLLEEVARHPMMGIYLSHLKNQKEDPAKGRVPDENFAREIMQLFTIGLQELNPDGSLKLKNGQPIETYDMDDITGLARVFTGFSYGGPGSTDQHFFQQGKEPHWDILPMKGYPKFHSASEKHFLGVTIKPQTQADPEGDLKIALDRLFNHPNVGPFFGRQLIQRLVTSNPSPAYVERVARAFNDNGAGVRGDMQAVIRAVLLDPEARNPAASSSGKLREPILRLSQWMRAFHATSASGEFRMQNTDSPANSLGQSPLRSPSVFNFYRPGFMPPGSEIARKNMVAPEMQIVSESAVAGYANFIQTTIDAGAGRAEGGRRDIQPDYSAQMALASQPASLVEQLDLLLTGQRLTEASRQRITTAVAALPLPASPANALENAQRNRVKLAILLVMVSPEYLVQK